MAIFVVAVKRFSCDIKSPSAEIYIFILLLYPAVLLLLLVLGILSLMMVIDTAGPRVPSNLFPVLIFVCEIVYFPAMYRQLFLINWPRQLTSPAQIYLAREEKSRSECGV